MSRYPLNIFWSEEDKGFIAEVPDLPGCSAWGETEAEAAHDAIAAWLAAAKSAKRGVPEPNVGKSVDHYSGKFLVRVPSNGRYIRVFRPLAPTRPRLSLVSLPKDAQQRYIAANKCLRGTGASANARCTTTRLVERRLS